MKLLIANRGEIALRIIRTARELGVPTVAVYAADDADTPHVAAADHAVALAGSGPAAYLDGAAIVAAATGTGADAVHPGYGFLAENADFAAACADAGVTFVGPDPAALRIFGDKAAARAAAVDAGVPVPAATDGGADLETVRAFAAGRPGGVMIKAVAGGGGRGMRAVRPGPRFDEELESAYRACVSEAELGFGDGRVFAEELQSGARHIEVQVVGDGAVAIALGDRDCSVQRRNQKLIEVAPAPALGEELRAALHGHAARLCAAAGYRGLATVEFLVRDDAAVFLEVNPRIQVEHTVTEEVTGVDLVAVQLALAEGAPLSDLGLPAAVVCREGVVSGAPAAAHGTGVQARVNLEVPQHDGTVLPSAGPLTGYTPPTGPGVRVDDYGRPGLTTSARYDSLLAKVIVRAASPARAYAKASAALGEFVIEGPGTNLALLRAVLADPEFRSGPVDTGYLGRRLGDLVPEAGPAPAAPVDLDGDVLTATMTGTVVAVAEPGAAADAGAALVVLEAMKMEHEQVLTVPVTVGEVLVRPGETVTAGAPLLTYLPADGASGAAAADALDLDRSRADLDEVRERHRVTLDEGRPAAVAKRRRLGRRTARENIDDLVDPGSFTEYGALLLPAQRARRSEEQLIATGPADGLIGGLATIGGAEAMVISYDYTVLAGTQGWRNHAKTDRLIDIADRRRLPIVLFAEGGGGRPGDTDLDIVAGLDVPTFRSLGALRGRVPLIAVVSGRCFAGNAALAGICDVIIATPDANIGMGGPAMISGGGLGEFAPEAIGPIDVQRRNGVVHLVADDEADAVDSARRYLGYFTGPADGWTAPDPRIARHVIPENRLRAYDVRAAIAAIADEDSVLELRRDYGVGLITALVRVEGVPYALIANSTRHLGGAIDAEGADKLADFLELAQAHGLPVVSLCDTPGFMVGPEAEEQATVRRFSRLFVLGARLTVPLGVILLRKGYGLGAMAMAGGGFHAPQFTVSWPTGEIGGMGLEGAVRLGFSKELAAAPDETARAELFDQLLALAYQRGRALHAATTFELDDVIDPAATRSWIRTLTR